MAWALAAILGNTEGNTEVQTGQNDVNEAAGAGNKKSQQTRKFTGCRCLAEAVRFELTSPCGLPDFESGSL